jgi:leucyl/phenylalanyl-tRNA--protein transferase
VNGQRIIHPQTLLDAYARGVFPMAESADSEEVYFYEPRLRGILPMDGFRVSKNVRRLVRNGGFEVWLNREFKQVIKLCGDTRPETWINSVITASYATLHELGFAHSLEVYRHGELAGGLYGVALGGAFMGESMFRLQPEADKIALLHCHQVLLQHGFTLWDTQYWTPHLAQFGCIEIPQRVYRQQLQVALQHPNTLPTRSLQIA